MSLRAALIASLIAKNADDARNSGGSPTAWLYTRFDNINCIKIFYCNRIISILNYYIHIFTHQSTHKVELCAKFLNEKLIERDKESPTLEEYTALGLEVPFNRETLNS